jgi:hypothetical protein
VAMSVFCSSHVVVYRGRLTLTGRGVSTERCVGSRIARVKIRRFVGAASGNLGTLPTGIAFCKRDGARTLRRLASPPWRYRHTDLSIAAVEHAVCAGWMVVTITLRCRFHGDVHATAMCRLYSTLHHRVPLSVRSSSWSRPTGLVLSDAMSLEVLLIKPFDHSLQAPLDIL